MFPSGLMSNRIFQLPGMGCMKKVYFGPSPKLETPIEKDSYLVDLNKFIENK